MTRRRTVAAPTIPEPAHRRSVLPSGLRVVSRTMPGSRSVSVALIVPVGARHEDEAHAGLSHLLEHLVFKGTAAHPEPGSLSQYVEGVGGMVNASTDRELTVFSAKVPSAQADAALTAVSELALRPMLRRRDLSAEKPVIADEIRMYVDSPSDHVFTLFDELLFGRHPLGREIAGSIGSVRRATHDGVVEHWRAAYRPGAMVLAAAGAVDHDQLLAAADGWRAEGPPSGAHRGTSRPPIALAAPEPAPAGALRVSQRRLSQANLCVGMPALARDDPDRWTLDLLGAILGDGMGSRLFIELRERRSLVYDVSTFSALYADTGVFGIHAGFDPEEVGKVVGAILDELERVVTDAPSEEELRRARAYTRGRLELRMEDSAAVAGWLGMGETLLPRILTVDEVIARLEAVTRDDLLRVARTYLAPDKVRLAALGPFRSRRPFERAMRR